jgi:hypothetical protein
MKVEHIMVILFILSIALSVVITETHLGSVQSSDILY